MVRSVSRGWCNDDGNDEASHALRSGCSASGLEPLFRRKPICPISIRVSRRSTWIPLRVSSFTTRSHEPSSRNPISALPAPTCRCRAWHASASRPEAESDVLVLAAGGAVGPGSPDAVRVHLAARPLSERWPCRCRRHGRSTPLASPLRTASGCWPLKCASNTVTWPQPLASLPCSMSCSRPRRSNTRSSRRVWTRARRQPLERDMLRVELQRLESERLLQSGAVERALIDLKRALGMAPGEPLTIRDDLEQLVRQDAAAMLPPAGAPNPTRPDVEAARRSRAGGRRARSSEPNAKAAST